ncbi:MAG: SDR family oxidoreductase [Rhodoferax sp.]|nr:SDR family oxidoreductase [Rhodoferax sp.]OIP20966.1 MAG: short chain dehydrogenase [Comamonadaceae bacterium CG2_30_60_41]PIW08322.1 MAG: short chain dehydrogenase [Comamonadaceae bacterium CG17_big_fil_post_rev_8_21_14_2_50_60_13]PIY23023.1 MAG: short chain dehydrogenase [Comamonadaceae bacterium CG_4_10_14_3_um_filter_60_75]PJC11459.1 MAG: short chain dehydrogenase [Comamonadaceae bacterium CG_4_9_14_0_8_um_filter_60_18]
MSTQSLNPDRQPTVLITGAAKRLGREIALHLATAGWRVAVHYRDSVDEARKTVADCTRLAGASTAFRANLANETAVRHLLPSVVEEFGYVDALVNSASTFEHDTVATFSFAALEKHIRSNAGAAVLLSQALHEHLASRDARGAVVNLLDQKLWNPNPDFLSYTLSKAALESANTLLAMELAPRVRVVGVAPGLTLTSHMLSPEKFDTLHKLAPLGHSSTAADVAATVAFALTNNSITGTTLLVDGGQHLMKFERDFSLM